MIACMAIELCSVVVVDGEWGAVQSGEESRKVSGEYRAVQETTAYLSSVVACRICAVSTRRGRDKMRRRRSSRRVWAALLSHGGVGWCVRSAVRGAFVQQAGRGSDEE
jgi:Fe-S oxidoreductase